jgi:hypothetical protein
MLNAGYAADSIVATFSGAGSNVATSIDTNGDGITAFLATGLGYSSLGTFTTRNVNETLGPVGTNTANCPGALELPLLIVNTVFTFEDTSQFWEKLVSGYFCLSPDGTFTLSAKTQIVNGTGRFDGVTGSIQATAKGNIVLQTGDGPTAQVLLAQTSFQGTFTIVPKQP